MTVKAKIIAINQLLSDIYQQQMRLSYLFAEMDFTLWFRLKIIIRKQFSQLKIAELSN